MLDFNDDVSLPTKILLNTTYVLLYPVIYFFKARHIRQHDRRDGYIRMSPSPLPVKPRRRGRALSLESPPTTATNLLLGLPREIRDLIWIGVVGGMKIHWWIEDRKLKGFRCLEEGLEQRDCFPKCLFPGISDNRSTILGAMGLLLTCRQTYSESIEILYSGNMVIVQVPEVISHLPKMLLSKRLNDIRSLRFIYLLGPPPSMHRPSEQRNSARELKRAKKRNNYYRKTWFLVWNVLAEMRGLAKLTVELNIAGMGAVDMWTWEDFEVIKGVTMPEKFSLILPESLSSRMVRRVGGLNCQVSCLSSSSNE